MQPGCTTQARALQAERYGLVHVTRQRAPGAVVHDSNHGFQGRFGEGFDFGEGGEAGSLGGFRGLFLQEHVRTRTTAGTRGSQHRLYWEDSGTPITQLLVPALFAKQGCVHVVSSSRLPGTEFSSWRS